MAAIKILLNGETREIPREIKLDQLLDFYLLPKKRVAIEVNNHVIRRVDWQNVSISNGDKIEIVHFVGGG